jgi:hypothetical protein
MIKSHVLQQFSIILPLSVPWDKGTLGIKPKEFYPGPPRAGSRVWHRTRTPTGYKLCQEGGQRQATHQILGVGPVPTGLGIRAHHVTGILTPKSH